jgi:hypothetical protein
VAAASGKRKERTGRKRNGDEKQKKQRVKGEST